MLMRNSESMNQVSKKNCINIRIIIVSTLVGLLNSFFYDNLPIMLSLCLLEVVVLLFYVFSRKYTDFLGVYLVSLSLSMESSNYVGSDIFYGFKNFRIGGVNLAVWMLVPMLFIIISNMRYYTRIRSNTHTKLVQRLGLFTLLGIICGIITWLSGDNGFGQTAGSFQAFFNSTYSYIMSLVLIYIVSFIVAMNPQSVHRLKEYLFAVIVATAIVLSCCMLFGNYGNRGGTQSLQISEIYVLLIVTPALVTYQNFDTKSKIILGLSGILILFLSLLFNSGGKSIIVLFILPVLMIYLLIKRGVSVRTVFIAVLIITAAIIVTSHVLPRLIQNSLLFEIKYDQVIKLFSVGSGNWFENIPESPKMRITEFLNISYEFIKKPWFLLFGKGFAGTIKDNLKLFNNLSVFAFSQWELNLGAYYTMHESINSMFLIGGVNGLITLYKSVILVLKRLVKSPWLVYGLMWLLLYYGFHLTIAIFGVVSLVVGLSESDE